MSGAAPEALSGAGVTAATRTPAHPVGSGPISTAPGRIQSVDLLRGLVMIIMALDHVRDYFAPVPFDPVDLEATNPALFFTRWITHVCAPVFVLLAGTSAGFLSERKSKGELSLFLLSRGVWLILIEMTVISAGWAFPGTGYAIILQVIWAIGASMIVLAGLIWLPRALILMVGLMLVFGHNLLDTGLFPEGGGFQTPSPFWHILHNSGFSLLAGLPVFHAYPVLPWIGVMALGYCLAALFRLPANIRRRRLLAIGGGAALLFVILRLANFYGDPAPWSVQETTLYSLMSFLNTEKYPPSLLYLLMTLGPGLVFLALAERWQGPVSDALAMLGRVPFFFYIVHLYLIHLLAGATGMLLWGFDLTAAAGGWWTYPAGSGFPLIGAYIAWAAILLLLYPACRWFAAVKANRKDWWLSYL